MTVCLICQVLWGNITRFPIQNMHIPVYFLAHVTSWSLYVDGKQGRRICRHMRIVSLTHQTRTTIEPQIGWYRSKRLIVLGLEADLVSNESIMIALMTDRIFSFPMQTWICIRSKIGQHISGFWFYHQKNISHLGSPSWYGWKKLWNSTNQ